MQDDMRKQTCQGPKGSWSFVGYSGHWKQRSGEHYSELIYLDPRLCVVSLLVK